MRYAAFIRNVMIGRKGLSQEVLLGAFAACGAPGALSFLATGNVAFSPAPANADLAEPAAAEQLVTCVQANLAAQLGLQEPFFVRSLAQLASLAAAAPFAAAPPGPAYERCITFLPAATLLVGDLPVTSPRGDFTIFARTTAEVFSITRLVGNRPGQPGKWLEQQTGARVTTRNWNTVTRLLTRCSLATSAPGTNR